MESTETMLKRRKRRDCKEADLQTAELKIQNMYCKLV